MSENQDQVLSGSEIANRLVANCVNEHTDEIWGMKRGQSIIYSGPVDLGNRLFSRCAVTWKKSDRMAMELEAVFDGEKVLKAVMTIDEISVETYVPGEWEKLVP